MRARPLLWALSFVLALFGCAELAVFEVSPARLVAKEGGAIEVRGAGFDARTELRLEAPGLFVTLGAVEVVSPEKARGRVPASAPAGTYDVVAARGGVEARLERALALVEGEARVVFVDVGQGDATLVIAPFGETLLIDGGPESAADKVQDALERHAAGRLDAVVLSHFDADHLAGLVGVLSGRDRVPGNEDDLVPPTAIGPRDDGRCDTAACDRFRRLRAGPFEAASVGMRLSLGDVEVEVVAAEGDVGDGPIAGADDENERSVVVLLRFGERTVLVTGDLTGGGDGTADLETPLAARTGPIDVLRVSHHGSRTSSAAAALAAWQPRAAVLSVGTDNAYCHPAPEVVARLQASGAKLYATGAGIVNEGARCGGRTEVPKGARFGMGEIVLTMGAQGELEMAGEAL